MSYSHITRWSCDRCSDTIELDHPDQPLNWIGLLRLPLPQASIDHDDVQRIHLCRNCAQRFGDWRYGAHEDAADAKDEAGPKVLKVQWAPDAIKTALDRLLDFQAGTIKTLGPTSSSTACTIDCLRAILAEQEAE